MNNMARSLKERRELQRLNALKEHITVIDRQMLNETRVAILLIEAMDQNDLDKVSKVIEKLERVKNACPGLPSLQQGIEAAQGELNKYTAGGPLAKAWGKLKSRVGIDNPVVKITTFANALERGFGQLPQILKNSGIDTKALKDNTDMTLKDAIVKQFVKSPDVTADMLKKSAPNKNPSKINLNAEADGDTNVTANDVESNAAAEKDAKKKIDVLVSQLRKALSPGGVFGVFKKVPYVNMENLTRELLTQAKVSELLGVFRAVKSGPQTAEFAADIKQSVAGGGGEVGTSSTTVGSETKPTGQTASSSPAEPTTPGGTPPAETGAVNPTTPGTKPGGGTTTDLTTKKKAAELGVRLQKMFSNPNANPALIGKFLLDAGVNIDSLESAISKHAGQKAKKSTTSKKPAT